MNDKLRRAVPDEKTDEQVFDEIIDEMARLLAVVRTTQRVLRDEQFVRTPEAIAKLPDWIDEKLASFAFVGVITEAAEQIAAEQQEPKTH